MSGELLKTIVKIFRVKYMFSHVSTLRISIEENETKEYAIVLKRFCFSMKDGATMRLLMLYYSVLELFENT